MQKTITRSITLNASPAWPGVENDYILRYDGHTIGRIRLDQSAWEWQITISHGDAGMGSRSLDESKRAFAAAWGRLLKRDQRSST